MREIPSDMLANLHKVTKITEKIGNHKICKRKFIFYERVYFNHPLNVNEHHLPPDLEIKHVGYPF